MKQETNFSFNTNDLGFSDLGSLAKIIDYLSDHKIDNEVTVIGYNNTSGNVYAYFEDSNTYIISSFNQEVSFMGYHDEEEITITGQEFINYNTNK